MKNLKVLFYIIPLFFLLAACGNLTIEIEKDGSGQVEIEMPSNEFISVEMLEKELESELEENEGVSKLSIKESDDRIRVNFQFDDVSGMDPASYQIPVSDYVVTNDSKLEELQWDGEMVEFDEKSSEIFIQLPGDLNSFNEALITLPGDVIAHTDNVEVVESDTIKVVSSGSVYVAYEPKSSISGFVGIGILVIGAAAAVIYFRNNKNKQPKQEKEGDEIA